MNKYVLLMSWKTQYYYNSHQIYLYIKCNNNQNPHKAFCSNCHADAKIHVQMQKTYYRQNHF